MGSVSGQRITNCPTINDERLGRVAGRLLSKTLHCHRQIERGGNWDEGTTKSIAQIGADTRQVPSRIERGHVGGEVEVLGTTVGILNEIERITTLEDQRPIEHP